MNVRIQLRKKWANRRQLVLKQVWGDREPWRPKKELECKIYQGCFVLKIHSAGFPCDPLMYTREVAWWALNRCVSLDLLVPLLKDLTFVLMWNISLRKKDAMWNDFAKKYFLLHVCQIAFWNFELQIKFTIAKSYKLVKITLAPNSTWRWNTLCSTILQERCWSRNIAPPTAVLLRLWGMPWPDEDT